MVNLRHQILLEYYVNIYFFSNQDDVAAEETMGSEGKQTKIRVLPEPSAKSKQLTSTVHGESTIEQFVIQVRHIVLLVLI